MLTEDMRMRGGTGGCPGTRGGDLCGKERYERRMPGFKIIGAMAHGVKNKTSRTNWSSSLPISCTSFGVSLSHRALQAQVAD